MRSLFLIFEQFVGEVTERLKVHAWNACVGKLTEGSNPSLTATVIFPIIYSEHLKKNITKEHQKNLVQKNAC